MVQGRPPQPEGTVELALTQAQREQRGWWMEADPAGQAARHRLPRPGRGGRADLAGVPARAPAARTRSASTAPRWAARCWAIRSMARRPPQPEGRRCTCMRARSALPLYPNRPPVAATAPPPPHMVEALRRCGYGAPWSRPGRRQAAAETTTSQGERTMFKLIISLVVAGVAGWLAGNIMKAQPIVRSAAARSSAMSSWA